MKSIKVLLRFPADKATKPVSYHLVKDFDLVFNIFQAHVAEGRRGELAMEITGEQDNIDRGLQYLRDEGIEVIILSRSIMWDSDACVHCGACTAVCPTDALTLDEQDMLQFEQEKCIVCELCIKACPMSVLYLNHTIDSNG